jgi:short-subunit dehydrogenase
MKTMNLPCVILGSLSGIAREIADQLARKGTPLVLVARSAEELEIQASDLKIRYGITVETIAIDASELDRMSSLPEECAGKFKGEAIGCVILCWGVMFFQGECEKNAQLLKQTFDINLTSSALVLQAFANKMSHAGGGTIVGISSVAGDRGRGSNYLYGASKAGLSALLDGMRHRFHGTGVRVVTVKPGMVNTPMTKGIVNPSSPLCASPHRVAEDIVRGIEKRSSQIYTPGYWRFVMAVIRNIPEQIFLGSKL